MLFGTDEIPEPAGISGAEIIVLGPMPPRIAKLSNKFRYRLIVKCRNTKGFRSMIETLLTQFPKDARFREVTVYADLNPENIY